jgi:hypothetical protein
MANWRRVWATLTVALAVAGLTGPAWGEFKPRVSYRPYGNAGSLVINGEHAVRFQAPNGNLSALDRARVTTERLSALVNAKLDPTTIRVEGDKRSARIYAGDKLICIATSRDAKLYHVTSLAVANKWASQMRELLLMPPVTLAPSELTVPLGEKRQVDIGGAAVGPVYAKIDDSEIASVVPETGGKRLTVSARKLGRASVEVSIEGERATLVVFVKKYAGVVPVVAVGQVTGNPCPAQLVCYSARQAVAQGAALEPSAELEIGRVDGPSQPLPSGRNRQIKVDVRISGRDYIPVSTKANVDVRNVVFPREDAAQLFYSNDPESITKYQPLFAGKLDLNRVTRILYHHQNEMSRRVHVIVELVNPSDTTAKVRVFRGISPPSVDTIIVGHVAGNAFMRDCANDVSIVETIPAQSRLVLVSDTLSTKETASGILQVKQMEGQSTYVRITAAEPGVDNVSRGSMARASDSRVLILSDQIYPSPTKTLTAEYVIGSHWAFIPIGKHALNDNSQQKKLYGNYGVTYNINVRISNPTSTAKKVSFVFDPTAGPASGVFIINGKFALAKYAQPPNEITLASITLNPGETRKCHIVTVPLAGSNYPATLIVKS